MERREEEEEEEEEEGAAICPHFNFYGQDLLKCSTSREKEEGEIMNNFQGACEQPGRRRGANDSSLHSLDRGFT